MNKERISIKDAKDAIENAYCSRMNMKNKTIKLFRAVEAYKDGIMNRNDLINAMVDALENTRLDAEKQYNKKSAEITKLERQKMKLQDELDSTLSQVDLFRYKVRLLEQRANSSANPLKETIQ